MVLTTSIITQQVNRLAISPESVPFATPLRRTANAFTANDFWPPQSTSTSIFTRFPILRPLRSVPVREVAHRWPYSSACQIITFEAHQGNITSVSFHREGKWLVTGSEDGTIKIWDLRCVIVPHTCVLVYPSMVYRTTHTHRNYDNEAPGMQLLQVSSFLILKAVRFSQ